MAKKGGLQVKTFGGLNKKNFTKKKGIGDRLQFNDDEATPVQFVAPPDDDKHWKEIHQHVFNDSGWKYVPCLGDDCPLCDDEDKDVRKTSYQFLTNVYSFKEKKIVVMKGPKDLAGKIATRFERSEKRKTGSFVKKTWDVFKMKTTPVSYDMDESDKRPVKIDLSKCIDLDKYIAEEAARYFGDSSPASSSKSALDDDDDYEDEDTYDADELDEMEVPEIRSIAKSLGIKTKDSEGEKRSKKTLIKLILKKQG